ncbi:alpha/beta fold hydrolase [Aliikangiella sp. IMCC44359]|uniref:alpha/beta fold hydrolase n=1 Tax=Aliikangiella sp. IMCC44359 TaxID=3459125 RepID=UPI00403AA49F
MIEYSIKLAGVKCAVVEWNPGGSILVFALHGWLDNLASFESLIPLLPNIRLVAIDFPGHGHSEHLPEGSSYFFVDGLNLIDDLATYFKQDKINLLGHSMGGAISVLYAASQPESVARLVLIESVGPLTSTAQDASRLLRNSITQRRFLRNKAGTIYKSFKQALDVRAMASDIKAELIKPIVERGLMKADNDGYTWRADSRLKVSSPIRMSEEQALAVIEQILAKVLLIEGDKGFLIDNPLVQTRLKTFQNIKQVQLQGGHHVHLEQPEACGTEIEAFFKE